MTPDVNEGYVQYTRGARVAHVQAIGRFSGPRAACVRWQNRVGGRWVVVPCRWQRGAQQRACASKMRTW